MRSETEMIAHALEVQPTLLPYIPELLADFDELGSDADLIVKVLGDLDLPDWARVIDLGCGKGAVSVEIAAALGYNVLGFDLFEPFIQQCRRRAAEAGVARHCKFCHGDILKMAGVVEPADAVVFAALGDVLGPLDESIRVIRRFVNPGGYIIVADDYVKPGGSTAFPGFENHVSHKETLRRLTRCGDSVVSEVIEPPNESAIDEETEMIRRRGAELLVSHPELKDEIDNFIENQGAENQFIGENMISAVWALQRSDGNISRS